MKYPGIAKFSYSAFAYKALIFIATVAVIVYFLPRDGKFNYQFELGRPWKYGQLMATFDFPIYKDDAVIARELDSLKHAFQPYYNLDKSVESTAVAKLRESYNTKLKQILPGPEYYKYIERTLHNIYATGIISSNDMQRLVEQDSVTAIRIVSDKQASSCALTDIYSAKRAYERLLTSDTVRYSPHILRQCGLSDLLLPNLTYDKQRTGSAMEEMQNGYSLAVGGIMSGQKIIDRGEIVSAEKYSILESLRKESIKRSESLTQKRLILVGQVLFVSVLIFLFFLYLDLYRSDYYAHRGSLTLLFGLVVLYCVLTALMVRNNILNVNILPFAMSAIVIRVFLDSRTAFMAHLVTVLICSISLRLPYEFILVQIAGGIVAIFSLKELSQRSQIFRTAVMTTVTYALVYFAFELIAENDMGMISMHSYYYFIINGILLLFTYPLLFVLEKTFGFTSTVTLVELSNINNDLLKQMSETVPGTFQHSMQVSNLAAEAADRIGAKSQLVRTGALYHDIGKMENPAFFTENQSGGINPHKSLSYEQSAQIVISHVTNGVKLADKHDLPEVIKDFIRTHHGRGRTKYFYISWMNEHPGEKPDDELFTYPGPNPFTKETAVLMMADSVEAASRSLKEYTEESIGQLVDRIIDSQVEEGYFKECPITFRDIAVVKAVFKEKLRIIYHTRVSYPELKK